MLSWAPAIQELALRPQQCAGSAPFASAATQLTALRLAVDDLVSCTHADFLLEQCRQLQTLCWMGWSVSTVYPHSLREVTFHFTSMPTSSGVGGDSRHADALMLRLARLPHLHSLTLILASSSAMLPTTETLHCLRSLTVSFGLADRKSMDLQWLQAQQCDKLRVHVNSTGQDRCDASAMQQTADRLQRLQLHELHLSCNQVTSQHLGMWQGVRAMHRCSLTFYRCSGPLSHMPGGAELHIHVRASLGDIQVSWESLLLAAERVVILYARTQYVLSFCSPGSMMHAQGLCRPWQITVHADTCPNAFPAIEAVRPGVYFWQNQAAATAGWTCQP